jgi:hypothetical protein
LFFGGWRTQKQLWNFWAASRSEIPHDNVKNLFPEHLKSTYLHLEAWRTDVSLTSDNHRIWLDLSSFGVLWKCNS